MLRHTSTASLRENGGMPRKAIEREVVDRVLVRERIAVAITHGVDALEKQG